VFWFKFRRYFPIGARLVWPILLGLGVAVVAPFSASVRGLDQGPRLIVVSLGNLVGPASISPRTFYSWSRKPPCFSGLVWWNKPCPGSFEEKPWSGLFLKKSPEWRRKSALTECSSRASCYLGQKVGGSWFWSLEKLKISSEDMYPAAPEHISGFFCLRRTRIEGLLSCSLVTYFLSEVGGSWVGWMLRRHELHSVSIFFRIYCPRVPCLHARLFFLYYFLSLLWIIF
jgi:hypothetical protein